MDHLWHNWVSFCSVRLLRNPVMAVVQAESGTQRFGQDEVRNCRSKVSRVKTPRDCEYQRHIPKSAHARSTFSLGGAVYSLFKWKWNRSNLLRERSRLTLPPYTASTRSHQWMATSISMKDCGLTLVAEVQRVVVSSVVHHCEKSRQV